mmetsp:Transcript_2387/g.7037  ORF Transcript_2387/g.7037 Transcript_2387/m.7037 type:complete len:251 (-) Transcript_2387:1401-2153(-)
MRFRVRASRISESTTQRCFASTRSSAQLAVAVGVGEARLEDASSSLKRCIWMSRSNNSVASAWESRSVAVLSDASSARMMAESKRSSGRRSRSRREQRSPCVWTTFSFESLGGRFRCSRAFWSRAFCTSTSRPEKRWSSEPGATKSSSSCTMSSKSRRQPQNRTRSGVSSSASSTSSSSVSTKSAGGSPASYESSSSARTMISSPSRTISPLGGFNKTAPSLRIPSGAASSKETTASSNVFPTSESQDFA